MRPDRKRTIISFLVFVGWLLITVFVSAFWVAVRAPQSIEASVSQSVQPGFAIALVFLFAAVAIFRWRDVGLNPPRAHTLRLLWFPALYIAVFFAVGIIGELPPASVVLIILVNTLMVGVSEELACRGILYRGFRASAGIWPSILGSTIVFGSIHIFNGIGTGDFGQAAIQAGTAFMTGIAFMGIRLRTGSLYPGMLLHWLWNFALVTSAVGLSIRFGVDSSSASASSLGPWFVLVPILLILPNFLYGLFLLRRATRDEAAAG